MRPPCARGYRKRDTRPRTRRARASLAQALELVYRASLHRVRLVLAISTSGKRHQFEMVNRTMVEPRNLPIFTTRDSGSSSNTVNVRDLHSHINPNTNERRQRRRVAKMRLRSCCGSRTGRLDRRGPLARPSRTL